MDLLMIKPIPKDREDIIVKMCKKKEPVDEVFPDKDIELFAESKYKFVDKRDAKLVKRSEVIERLQKLMGNLSVDEFALLHNDLGEDLDEEEKLESQAMSKAMNKVIGESKAMDKSQAIGESKPDVQEEEENEKEKEKEKVEKGKERKKRTTKKQLAIQEDIDDSMVVFSKDLYKEITNPKKYVIHKASSYYMTNRRMFIQKLNTLFKPYADELSKLTDADVSCDKRSTEEFETLTHQKVVSDYLNLYSPYRGLLIFHGLGSGKTCTSITVAEGMKSDKRIIIMTPASLKSNFFSELKKCGDDIYRKNQFWIKTRITNKPDASRISKIISLDVDDILNKDIWLGKKTKGADGRAFSDLSAVEQAQVDEQLDLMIRAKYTDINYNGLNKRIFDTLTDNGRKNPFDNCVVIIDEAHNFVSRIVNKLKTPDSISYQMYDYLMSAQNSKIILLTGTPIINYPNEIAILFNILRGYIKTWTFPVEVKTKAKIDKDAILKFFEKDGFNTYDYMEYSGNKVVITRNPFGFVNVAKKSAGSSSEVFDNYGGVKMNESGNVSDNDFKNRVFDILNDNGLEVDKPKVKYENIVSLPDDADTFFNMFIDPDSGNLNNADLLKRRILGLTSYFKSAQEKLLPKYNANRDYKIIRVDMSDRQLAEYSLARRDEINRDKKKRKQSKMNAEMFKMASTYRIFSRELCNFVFPESYPRPTKKYDANPTLDMDPDLTEDVPEKSDDSEYATQIERALQYLKENGDQYLSKEGLRTLSPKFLSLLENIEDEEHIGLHLVYSQFRTIEGIGILKLILEQNGFAEFKLEKKSGDEWDIVDFKKEDVDKPKFVLYTGTETSEEKEIIRNIYNSNWKQLSVKIRNKLEQTATNNYLGEVIKVFMITASGAEGINLENTRFVHIAEPYWHPVRIEQVIGRARRICSHKNLPEDLRNLKVFLYLAKMSDEQKLNERNIELTNSDNGKTTDEYLFELAAKKAEINKQILNAVKETAMDCSLYNKSNTTENLVCYNFGRVASNEFSTVPILEQDASQHANLNVKQAKIAVLVVEILGQKYLAEKTADRNERRLYDIDTKEFIGNAILHNGKWRIEEA